MDITETGEDERIDRFASYEVAEDRLAVSISTEEVSVSISLSESMPMI